MFENLHPKSIFIEFSDDTMINDSGLDLQVHLVITERDKKMFPIHFFYQEKLK